MWLLPARPICYLVFEVFCSSTPIMPTTWKIVGSYFEACNCDLACPCVFLSPPTSGECTVLLAWHIDHGRFGEIDLDGFNTALAAYAPGHMLEVKWKVALYADERANKGQQDALIQIFSGQAGGHLAVLRRSSAKSSGLRQHRSNIVRRKTTQLASR
jgi:hypothetical protein